MIFGDMDIQVYIIIYFSLSSVVRARQFIVILFFLLIYIIL